MELPIEAQELLEKALRIAASKPSDEREKLIRAERVLMLNRSALRIVADSGTDEVRYRALSTITNLGARLTAIRSKLAQS